jgi:hypothetical protein
MGKFGWFMVGVLFTQAVYLVTTTTPEMAAKNLRDWWTIVRPSQS